jgi:hypothetical protein
MREDFPERPEMEDMRRLVELYARGQLPPDALVRETRRAAFNFNVVAPVRRWVVAPSGAGSSRCACAAP